MTATETHPRKTEFEQAIASANDKATVRMVYRDWLLEQGETTAADTQLAIVQMGEKRFSQLAMAIKQVNGRRRERTLTLADCLYVAVKAMTDPDGWYAMGGGHVAHAYGYPSYQTVCVAAIRTDGTIRIGVAQTSGSKGSSMTTPVTGLTKKAKPEAFKAWADAEMVEA